MEWGILLGIAGLAVMIQLAFFLLYIRLGRSEESVYPQVTGETGDRSAVTGSSSRSVDTSQSQQAQSPTGDARVCPNCGYENEWEPVFTYCSNCVAKLG